jgi:hypothetical protein
MSIITALIFRRSGRLPAQRLIQAARRGLVGLCPRAALLAAASALATSAEIAGAAEGSAPAAASDAETRARQRFYEGNQLFDRGLYEAALERFQSAYELWNNAKIKLNIATTLRAIGRNAEALPEYRHYLRDAQPSPDRRAQVEAICAELLERLAVVQISVATDVRNVWLDGLALDVHNPGSVYLEPGEHLILSEGPDGERTIEFEVRAGEMRELPVDATIPAANRSAPTKPAEPAEPLEPAAAGASFSLLARADIDGRGRGAVGALGMGYDLGAHWQVAGGGLFGRTPGVWAGVELAPGAGSLRPTFGLSAPVFFAAGARAGVSAEAGTRWAVRPDSFFLSLRAAVVYFPSAPEGYSKAVFVPSLGSELQL